VAKAARKYPCRTPEMWFVCKLMSRGGIEPPTY
jgi:hypothetical protein